MCKVTLTTSLLKRVALPGLTVYQPQGPDQRLRPKIFVQSLPAQLCSHTPQGMAESRGRGLEGPELGPEAVGSLCDIVLLAKSSAASPRDPASVPRRPAGPAPIRRDCNKVTWLWSYAIWKQNHLLE